MEDVPETAFMAPEGSGEVVRKTRAKHVVFLIVVALTSINQGTITKGWTAVLPKMQDDPHSFVNTNEDAVWLVSMTPIVGIFASLATGPMVEWVGPRRVIITAAGLSTALWLLLTFPPLKMMLYFARAGLAACAYIISATSSPLLAEMSPNNIRGLASSLSEIGGSIGVLYGYLMVILFPWRMASGLCILTVAPFVAPLWFVPESPYWLVRRGRTEAAKTSLQRLMGSKAKVEEELMAITSKPTATQTSVKQQFVELRKSQNLRPVLLVLSFFVLRELGGRSCIMMYTVYIFRDAGVELDAFTCTVLVGVARLLCTCVTACILDRIGRRPLLIITSVVGALSLTTCALFLYLQLPGASWVPLICVLVYVAAYGTGIGPIPWVYVGELIPSPVRSLGASVITACDALVVFSISLFFLEVISNIGLGVTLLTFGVLNFLIAIIVCMWIPESGGASLHKLEDIFCSHNEL